MLCRVLFSTVYVVLLLQCGCKRQKTKRTKQSLPSIACDVRAGRIPHTEFIVKCSAHCVESKQSVYGTTTFASISSVCNAAIHGGIITNSGGKVLVRKTLGQPSYRGSFSHGVRSLSLPRWRESFTVHEGKPQKGVHYPHVLYNTPTHHSTEVKSFPTTTTTVITSPKHPTTSTAFTSSSSSGRHGHEPQMTIRRPSGAFLTSVLTGKPRPVAWSTGEPADGRPAVSYTWREVDSWESASKVRIPRPVLSEYKQAHHNFGHSGFTTDPSLPNSLGDPNCKVDLVFLVDGSWSIGRRRFHIQKDFLVLVSQKLNLGPAGPMMGIIQYGDNPVTEFNLKAHQSSNELKAAVNKIQQKGGMSNVGKAVAYTNTHYFTEAGGNRGGAPNVMVVLVDGWPTDRLEESSRLARESGINIFFLTIEGPDISEKENVVEENFVDKVFEPFFVSSLTYDQFAMGDPTRGFKPQYNIAPRIIGTLKPLHHVKAVCRTDGFFSLSVSSWFRLQSVVEPLVTRVCDTERLVCSKTCLNAHDVAFVIDGSSSVGTSNFHTVLRFVSNVTRQFEISDTDTRVGVVQYTYEQRLEIPLGQHSQKAQLLSAIQAITYWSGGTSTGAAITYAANYIFSQSKPNKRKIMIVITDGRSYDDVRSPALAIHRAGVIAYSIGIAWAVQEELEFIASDPDKEHTFFVDDFDNLHKFVPKLIHNICQEFNSQPRN